MRPCRLAGGGEDRLCVAPADVELVAQSCDGDRAGHPVDAGAQRRPDIGGVVDPRRDLPQLAGSSQLVDDRGRDPEPAGDAVNARRRGSGGTQPPEQGGDPFGHLGLHAGLRIGEADPSPASDELAGGDEIVDHASKLGLGEVEPGAAAVPARRAPLRELDDASHQGVHAQVDREWLGAMESAQCKQDEALGNVPLVGVDRPDRHAGRVPSIAIRMACDSSSDRLCGESPDATGLAKTLVFARP